jgi:prolyl oligopeptidase
VTDTHFGTTLIDPFRWMEAGPNPEFDRFLRHRDADARSVLNALPGRARLSKEISAIVGLTTEVSSVTLAGSKVVYLKRGRHAEVAKLYIRDTDSATETTLLNPTRFGGNGEPPGIDQFAVSPDVSHIVYILSDGVLHVIRTATRRVLPDTIDGAQLAAAPWAPDGKSFFYSRPAEPRRKQSAAKRYSHMRTLLHRLGTDPATDRVILDSDHLPFPFEAAQVFLAVSVTPGSEYAIATVADGVSPEQAYYVAPIAALAMEPIPWKKLADKSDDVTLATVRGRQIFMLTHRDAPRLKAIAEDLDNPGFATATLVIAQPEAGVLTSLRAGADALYIAQRDGAVMHLSRLPYGNKQAVPIALPFDGTIAPPEEDSGDLIADPRRPGAWLGLQSWLQAPVWMRYDPAAARLIETDLVPRFPRDLSAYEVTETTAKAADGTLVPLSIVTKRGIRLDGSHPTLIEGYGSYGASLDAAFAPRLVPWLDRGGVFAVAHVRGGGELGQTWHDAGKIETKENTIGDYLSCAEELIRRGYTTSRKLGGEGASAGGITVGGAITQRPDLFRAVVIAVGSLNSTRSEFTESGPANIPEFGSVTNSEQFPYVLAMDAYQHVKDGTPYPAVLLTGGYDDPLVAVWEPAKMAARLQAATSSGRPVLLRVDFDGGHEPASARARHDEETDEFAFLLWQFDQR